MNKVDNQKSQVEWDQGLYHELFDLVFFYGTHCNIDVEKVKLGIKYNEI